MPRPENTERDFRFGIHSLIPQCCVEYYCGLLKQGIKLPGQHIDELVPELKYNEAIEYVPCLDCAAKIVSGDIQPAKLHYCKREYQNDNCNEFLDLREEGIRRARERREVRNALD